jgi:hypothetical protein
LSLYIYILKGMVELKDIELKYKKQVN